MRIPQHPRRTNAATDFFHKCRASQRRGTGLFLCGAQGSFFQWSTKASLRVAMMLPSGGSRSSTHDEHVPRLTHSDRLGP
jgi:hypothetical protein